MHGAGDPDPDDGDNNNDNAQDEKGGTSRKEKAKCPEGQDPEEEDEEQDVVEVMAKAITRERLLHTKRPSDPPWVFKHKSHQDIRIWLMAVQEYFERNSHQWTMETDRVKYAMGRMEGDNVAPVTDTYRKKMSGALGYRKEIGYERWFMFEQKVSARFAPTQEAKRTHKLMKLERYHGDIRQFLFRMEKHNIKVGHPPSPLLTRRLKSQHHEIITTFLFSTPRHEFALGGGVIPPLHFPPLRFIPLGFLHSG